jgi:hypothetical protein
MKQVCIIFAVGFVAGIAALSGCQPASYNPAMATRAYPEQLHTTDTVDMQVFRDDTTIELVNTTANTYTDVDVWLNQRYVLRVDELPAGGSLTLSLWDFYDERGEVFNAGGLFRSVDPTPLRLVELQTSDTEPMVGLITIRAEDAPEPISAEQ